MADKTYGPAVYIDSGGARLNAVSGATVNVESGATETHANTPLFSGGVDENAVGGSAFGARTIQKSATSLADNTAADFDVACTVTIPNANHAASIEIFVHASLGDQDSTEASYWTIAISRIAAGATSKAVSSKGNAVNTTGASGNAQTTISTTAVSGANSATQTFKIQVKVARSAGSAANHDAMAYMTLLNVKGSGVTIS